MRPIIFLITILIAINLVLTCVIIISLDVDGATNVALAGQVNRLQKEQKALALDCQYATDEVVRLVQENEALREDLTFAEAKLEHYKKKSF